PGQRIVLLVCTDPTATTLDVVAPDQFSEQCPGALASAIFEETDGTDLSVASGGTLTLDEVGDPASGSFMVEFGADGSLSGTFSALLCGVLAGWCAAHARCGAHRLCGRCGTRVASGPGLARGAGRLALGSALYRGAGAARTERRRSACPC